MNWIFDSDKLFFLSPSISKSYTSKHSRKQDPISINKNIPNFLNKDKITSALSILFDFLLYKNGNIEDNPRGKENMKGIAPPFWGLHHLDQFKTYVIDNCGEVKWVEKVLEIRHLVDFVVETINEIAYLTTQIHKSERNIKVNNAKKNVINWRSCLYLITMS